MRGWPSTSTASRHQSGRSGSAYGNALMEDVSSVSEAQCLPRDDLNHGLNERIVYIT